MPTHRAHMQKVCTLFARYVLETESAAFSVACSSWREMWPVLTRLKSSSGPDVHAFWQNTASFVAGLLTFFSWTSVAPRLHALCCHASDYLNRFGSLGRYSEQGKEACLGHFNHSAMHDPVSSFFESSVA